VSLNILQRPLPYADRLQSRGLDNITLLVIHCTELPDLAMARVWGEKVHHPETQTGNSGHFYVDRNGSVEEWVPIKRVAHHVIGYNPQSIGIELVNNGRYPNWFNSNYQVMSEPYPDPQFEALVALVKHLQLTLPGLKMVAGHEDLDTGMVASQDRPDLMIRRKLDPGVRFEWSRFMNNVSLKRFKAKDP
jgi:N-acetylmuramoyl-L-alanine amidase